MKKQIVFFSKMIPACDAENVRKNSRGDMMSSAIAFQEKLLDGFDALCNHLSLCNVEAIFSYPQYYRQVHIPSFRYCRCGTDNLKDYNVGFNNMLGVRQASMYRGLCRGLRVLNSEQEIDAIVIYSPETYFLKAAAWFKKQHPETKICLIIPDLPDFGYLAEKMPLRSVIYQHMQNAVLSKAFTQIDAMVFLTEQTAEYLKWKGKYAVVEGIASAPAAVRKTADVKTIVYTGTTHRRFGLPVLVQAMAYLPQKDVRLIVCGCGDYDEDLRSEAAKDSRICFMGVVPHNRALQIQMDASVLVNPRQNQGEYTKYSFPSKTMEYLSTGNPVVAYRLDGMPAEYLPFIHLPKDDTPKALADAINELLQLSAEERIAQGEQGKNFVLTNKSAVVQVKKIMEMLR